MEKAKRDAEEREHRAKNRPRERERQALHMSEDKRQLVEELLRGLSVGGAIGGGGAGAGADTDGDHYSEICESEDVVAALRATGGAGTSGKPQTLNPKPLTLNPKPLNLNHKP